MSKKKDKKVAKQAEPKAGKGKAATKTVASSTARSAAEKVKPTPEPDHERMDGIAERLRLGAHALHADVDSLLKEVRKSVVKPSAKARKTLAAVAKEYRKAAKGLKKLSTRKG